MGDESLVQALLEHPSPSVRVCACLDLAREHRAGPPDNRLVQALQAEVVQRSPVKEILDAQYPAGYWMHAGLGVSPRYRATLWQVLFLAQLGAGPSPPIVRAVDRILRDNRDPSTGALRLRKGPEGHDLSLTAALLWAVARLGLADESAWDVTWHWVRKHTQGGCLDVCALVWVIRAAVAWQREPLLRSLTPPNWDLMRRHLCHSLTFPLTRRPDLLAGLQMCVEVGHPEWLPEWALSFLAGKRRAEGWPLEQTPAPMWASCGTPGKVNPWVSVRVLSVWLPLVSREPIP